MVNISLNKFVYKLIMSYIVFPSGDDGVLKGADLDLIQAGKCIGACYKNKPWLMKW